jgi:hypothetical protein
MNEKSVSAPGTDETPGTGVELRPARHSIRHGDGGTSSLSLPVVVPVPKDA